MTWRCTLLSLLLGLSACTTGASSSGQPSFSGAAEMAQDRERLRIQRGSLGLEVADVPQALREVETIGEALDAFVESRNQWKDESATLVLRVPAARLDEAFERLSALGDETQRRLDARDVSDEVGDLDARHQNLVALRDRLRTLLQRARSIDDVLSVEKELTRVQTELDALEGRRARLRGDVARARLELTLRERAPKRVLGPLGYVWYGTKWFIGKLFVLRDGAP